MRVSLGGKPALYCKSTVNHLLADRLLLWWPVLGIQFVFGSFIKDRIGTKNMSRKGAEFGARNYAHFFVSPTN